MAVITIDSNNFTEKQFLEMKALFEKYTRENEKPELVAANAFAKSLNIDEVSENLAIKSFLSGIDWQRGLLSEQDYEKIIYIITSSIVSSGQDDAMIAEAMTFVNKLCKVFNVDVRKFYEQDVF